MPEIAYSPRRRDYLTPQTAGLATTAYTRNDGLDLPGTPPKRVRELSELPANVKARVDAATAPLTGSRCLIENTSKNCSIDYVHAMSRSTPSKIVTPPDFMFSE